MTNIIACVLMTVATNWVSIGTFKPTQVWFEQTVERGQIVTNTTLIVEWQGQAREVVLETKEGPMRLRLNGQCFPNISVPHVPYAGEWHWPTNSDWIINKPGVMMTNVIHDFDIRSYRATNIFAEQASR